MHLKILVFWSCLTFINAFTTSYVVKSRLGVFRQLGKARSQKLPAEIHIPPLRGATPSGLSWASAQKALQYLEVLFQCRKGERKIKLQNFDAGWETPSSRGLVRVCLSCNLTFISIDVIEASLT